MPRPSTHAEIAAYLQWRAKEWVRSGRPARELAKAAGVTPAQISNLINHGEGAGWKTIEGMMRVFGLTMPELADLAREWAKDQPAPPLSPSLAAKRRAHAAELCVEDDMMEEAIRSVLDEPLREEDAKHSTVWWIKRMIHREAALAGAAPRRD
jgi:hypothetical protein